MLKQRIFTALVLVAVVMVALFAESSLYWAILINIVVGVGFWEWLRFCQINDFNKCVVSFVIFAALAIAAQLKFLPLTFLVVSGCGLWLVLFVFTLTEKVEVLHRPLIKLAVGMVLLLAGSTIVIRLHQLDHGVLWILCFFFCVWAADVGAYFVGKQFGKTKLAPNISPGKTIEGLLGGVALAAVIFVPIIAYNFGTGSAVLLLITILVTVLVSVLGDLFESKLKRHVGLKDSSQILPGHGGVLDRIDSLLAGAPFFALGLLLLGYAS